MVLALAVLLYKYSITSPTEPPFRDLYRAELLLESNRLAVAPVGSLLDAQRHRPTDLTSCS